MSLNHAINSLPITMMRCAACCPWARHMFLINVSPLQMIDWLLVLILMMIYKTSHVVWSGLNLNCAIILKRGCDLVNYVIEKLEQQYPTSCETPSDRNTAFYLLKRFRSLIGPNQGGVGTKTTALAVLIGRLHVTQTVAWRCACSLSTARSSYCSCLLQWKYRRWWVDIYGPSSIIFYPQTVTEWVVEFIFTWIKLVLFKYDIQLFTTSSLTDKLEVCF